MQIRLVVRKEQDILTVRDLGDDVVYLGRSRKSEVVLSDTGVSRRHAKVYQKGGKVFVEDLKSINGTKIKDKNITKSELPLHASFSIGPFTVTLEPTPAEDTTETTLPSEEGEVNTNKDY